MVAHRAPARWMISELAPAEFLGSDPALHPLLMQVLHARGMRSLHEAHQFLGLDGLAEAHKLADLDKAVMRVRSAIQHNEKIAIYGDYDCDGVTSCALLWLAFKAMGAHVQVYIPDRFEEGYGLNSAALSKLRNDDASLVVTVDCGGRAMKEARHASDIGLDLIITDHHDLEHQTLPNAHAVINPKRLDCPYPFKHLAGVGVAYRLMEAVWVESQLAPSVFRPPDFLDLVAIGTVADVMPLIGENRQMVRMGLQQINASPRLGVRELLRASAIKPGHCTARDLGFALGPRLNAAGRMESALSAHDLLTTDNEDWARALADSLNDQNNRRQVVTARVVSEAEAIIGDQESAPALVMAASSEFNAGVIGLAAARLMERHTRPAVVISINGDEARGSCRSVPGFHITDALDECAPLLTRHGGHAAAAGFSMDKSHLGRLEERLVAIAQMQMPPGGWERVIQADASLQLHKLTRATFDALQALEPHGHANPRPIFAGLGVTVARAQRMGRADEAGNAPHLKLILKDQRGGQWEAVGWRMGERFDEAPAGCKVDVIFQIDLNEWNGEARLQLTLLDWRLSDAERTA